MDPTQTAKTPFVPPHDIYELTAPRTPWDLWVLASILGVALILFLIFFIRKWKQRIPSAEPAKVMKKTVDPKVELANRLHRLEAKTPFLLQEREEFFYQLSMILRGFIELKTGLRATDMTSQEISEQLEQQRSPLSDQEVSAVLSFLHRADQIKFAGEDIGVVEAERNKADVEQWARSLMGGPLL